MPRRLYDKIEHRPGVSVNPSDQDEELVLRCREGDAAALDELLTRWQERLWRHALRLTASEDAAWDVLQEALIAIARGICRLEAESAFGVWAYRIVSHKARDWLRRHVNRRQRESRYAELNQADEPGEPSPLIAGVKEALDRLAPQDRSLLVLRFEDGFSINELAEMLGIPDGTVKSRLHAAKQRLRTFIKQNP